MRVKLRTRKAIKRSVRQADASRRIKIGRGHSRSSRAALSGPRMSWPPAGGQVAIVTGGGSSQENWNRRASAVCMAQAGARVLVADIAAENAQRTVDAIVEAGGEASVFVGDATSGGDCQAMVATAIERYGGLHVLMNNLGFRWGGHDVRKGVAEIDEDVLLRAFDLNLKSAVLASKHAIPAMVASGGGSIINVSSIDGIAGARHRGVAYSVTKGALPILTQHGGLSWTTEDQGTCASPGHLQSAYQSRLSRGTANFGVGESWDGGAPRGHCLGRPFFCEAMSSRVVNRVAAGDGGLILRRSPLLAMIYSTMPDLDPIQEP